MPDDVPSPATPGMITEGAPRSGHRVRTAETLFDLHGAAILELAMAMLTDAESAEAVLTEVIIDASNPHVISVAVERRELAKAVYMQCAGRRNDPGTIDLATTAIALVRIGDHSLQDAAALMQLPSGEVADLLRSGLRARRPA